VNGNVLGWMGIASSISGAAGVYAGRLLEWPSAYRQGVEAGRELAEIEARQRSAAEAVRAAQVERWQALMAGKAPPAGPVGAHGHEGPCSVERGCW
jgi:hypothetical protein